MRNDGTKPGPSIAIRDHATESDTVIPLIHAAPVMRLRVELYGAAQILKGAALAELRTLVKEIAMVLEVDSLR